MTWNNEMIDKRLALVLKDRNIVAYDSFTREDNDYLGWTDTKQEWKGIRRFGISNNSATSLDTLVTINYITTEISDAIVRVKFNVLTTDPNTRNKGITVRASDHQNCFIIILNLTNCAILRRVDGSQTELASNDITANDNSIIKVICNGNDIDIYVDDVFALNYSSPTFSNNTGYGLYASSTLPPNQVMVDYISVENL